MLNNPEKLKFRDYLLNSANDVDEIERMEIRLLSESDFFEAFQMCEDELVQEYADGKLTPEERVLFENNYLISPERKEKLLFALALRHHISQSEKTAVAPKAVEKQKNLLDLLFGNVYLRPAILSVFILILFSFAFLIWQKFDNRDADRALNLMNDVYKTSRPFDARVSNLDYAPFSAIRGNAAEKNQDNSKLSEAELILLNAANNDPNFENLHNLGRFYLLKKQFPLALETLDKAHRANPQNPDILNDLATAHLETGKLKTDKAANLLDLSRALELYSESLKINPQNPTAAFNKALTLKSLNLKQPEREAWEEYLKLDPGSKWSAEAKRKLKESAEEIPVSKQSFEILNDYLEAFRRKDEEKAYQIVSRNREMITNKLVPQQLVFLYSENPQNKEPLEALKFIAALEEKKSDDSFYLDISEFYEKLSVKDLRKMAVAADLIKSGYKFCSSGKDDAALAEFRKAKEIYLSAGNRPEAGFCDYWIGYCLARIGKISESKTLLQSLADFSRQKNYKWLESQAHNWQTVNFLSDNDLTNALLASEKSLKLAQETFDLYILQKSLTHSADIYHQSRNYFESLNRFGRLLKILSNDLQTSFRQKRRSYASIAQLFFTMKMFSVAEAFQKETLEIGLRLNDPSFISSSYKDLGVILGHSGNKEAANAMFAKSRAVTQTFDDSPLKARILAELDLHSANLLRLSGQCSQALKYYDDSIGFYSQSGFEIELYAAKKGRLLCYFKENKANLFETELRQVLNLFREYRAKILDEQNRNSFFDGEQDVYDIAISYAIEKNDLKTAFDYSEESRTRSLLDLQSSLGKVSNSSHSPEIRFSSKSAKPLEIAQIQANLPADIQILQYSVLPDRLLLWLIDKGSVSVTAVKIASSGLDEKIYTYRKYLSASDESENAFEVASAEELYELLIKPVEEKLAPEKVICIIPDKAIFQIPLNALISKSDGKFLIEKYGLMTSPSASVFIQSSQKAQLLSQNTANGISAENILAVGNPTFDKQSHPNLEDLPSAAIEAQKIAALYPKSTVLLAEDASEKHIERFLEKADIAHFAAHYLINEKNPLLSGLLTASESGGDPSNNILASHEIINRRLPKTKMIILSACQSGIEEYYGGEGMIGGARAYLAAGVPVVVASHWSIDSSATSELMITFHKNRRSSQISSVQALRQAQIEMIRSQEKRFGNPYYWAAFSLIGGYADY